MNLLTMVGLAVVVIAGLAAVLAIGPLRRFWIEMEQEKARELFRLQREMLEARFVKLAVERDGGNEGPWHQGDFAAPVEFARDAHANQINAFISVQLPADDAGTDARMVTAVFTYREGHWSTEGRSLVRRPQPSASSPPSS